MTAKNKDDLNSKHPVGRTYRSHSTVQAPAQLSEFSANSTPFLHYKTSDFLFDLRECTFQRRQNGFKKQLLDAWYSARERKVFNYDLNCVYKLLDGQYDISFQLNAERGTLRRKPMRFKHIRQPFDHLRFNFTKLRQAELLFHLRCVDRPYTVDKLDLLHTLAVNASPLEKGHSLILPSVSKCLPQVLNKTALRIAVDLMLIMEDETFHILFNSLLGQASVNHLHLHTLFWPYESGIITRKCDVLCEQKKVFVLRRPNWFIQAFVFQLEGSDDYDEFIWRLTKCAAFLTNKNVAHNLFITRAPLLSTVSRDGSSPPNSRAQFVTAYLFPRRNHTGAKPATNFNPAAVELAGFLTSYTYRFFESANEQTALRIIDEDAVLPEEVIERLIDGLRRRYMGELEWDELPVNEKSNNESKASITTQPIPSTMDLLDMPSSQHRVSLRSSKSINETTRISEELNRLEVKNLESLSSHELDELADSFHTVTSPRPRPRHYSLTDHATRINNIKK